MEEKKKKGKGGNGSLAFLITVLCWVPLFIDDIFPLSTLMLSIGVELASVIFLFIIVVSLIVSIIIHEAGHLVFGLLSGYGFCSFRIFSLMWIKTDDGIKLKRYSVPGTAGQCLLTPPEAKDGKMPTTIYNLGGSLLGLIATVVFAFATWLVRYTTMPCMLFATLSVANLMSALTNGIPMQTNMINNDGKNTLLLRRNPRAVESLRIQLLVNAENSKGVSLVDMPDEWFVLPPDDELTDAMVLSWAAMRFERLCLKDEYAEARDLALRMLSSDNLLGLHRASITISLAFVHIMLGEYDDARRIFKKEYYKNSALYQRSIEAARTRYAYELLVKGSESGARRQLCIFNMLMRKLKSYPFQSTLDHERELIEKINSIYEDRGSSEKIQ